MAEKNVKVVKKGRFGSFLLGFFIGIIFVIGAVVGVGYYAYKNLSLKTLEDVTGANIPVNDDIKIQSLQKLLQTTTDLISDSNNLTIQTIEQTFGFFYNTTGKDIPVGIKKSADGTQIVFIYNTAQLDATCIDLSSFHTTPVSQLSSKLSDFVQNLSLTDLQKVANFSLPDIPLINDVKDEPLMQALNEISNSLDMDNLTLADLKTKFDIDLSSVTALQDFMNIPLNGDGTNNLAYALQNATIANFTGLSKQANETEQAYAYRVQQAGVLGAISSYKITDLQTQLDTISIAKLMGLEKQYVRSGTEGNYTYTLETDSQYNQRIKDAGLMGALKDANLSNLQTKVEELDLANKKISELEELGLVDLSSYSQSDKEIVQDLTLTQIIAEYINAKKSLG